MRVVLAFVAILLTSSCQPEMADLPSDIGGSQSTQPSSVSVPPAWTPTTAGEQPGPAATSEPSASPTPMPAVPSAAPLPTQTPEIPTQVTVADLRKLDMQSSTRGWAVAPNYPGAIFRTVDGGFTWADVTPPQQFPEFLEPEYLYPSTFFLDALQGWAIFPGEDSPVWQTADGGKTWQPSSQTFSGDVYDMFFSNPSHGWLFRYWGPITHDQWPKDLYRTGDGGATWELLVDGYDSQLYPAATGQVFLGALSGWISTSSPDAKPSSLLVTHDGGATWKGLVVPPPSQNPGLFNDFETSCIRFGLHSPTLFTQAHGAVVLSCDIPADGSDPPRPAAANYLYRTLDYGVSWITSEVPGNEVVFIREDSAWSATQTPTGLAIFHSTDTGATWSRVKTTAWQGTVFFVSDVTAYALAQPLGDSPDPGETKLLRSTDGSRTWEIIEPVFLRRDTP